MKQSILPWMTRAATLALLFAVACGVGCVGGGESVGGAASLTRAAKRTPGVAVPTIQAGPVAADLEAVLAMAGTFAVSYRHAETAALAPGRALAKPYAADARECVRVVERSPGRVSLQHLLLIGDAPLVVKHWREDWEHAAGRQLVYGGPVPGGGRWSVQAVSRVAGQWTRTIYGADDAPGYASVGRWTHHSAVGGAGAVSEWEAQAPSAAPVARHEADGAASDAVRVAWGRLQGRVVVQHGAAGGGVGGGWTREESVVKLNVQGMPLAREHGVIRYVRRGKDDLPAVDAYWDRVGGFWGLVRSGWERRLPTGETRRVLDRLPAGPRWRALFGLADAQAQESAGQLDAVLDAAVDQVGGGSGG